MRPHLLPLALALAGCVMPLAGCSGPVSRQDLEAARGAVESALQAWKDGQRIDSLRSRPEPVEVTDDDWQRGWALTAFEVLKVHGQPDGLTRCSVRLSLRGAGGRTATREVTYAVTLRPRVVVGRDPYF